MDVFIQLISNLGFPIACVVALFYFINKSTDKKDEDARERERLYNQKVDEFQQQVNRFNSSIDDLNDTLQIINDRLCNLEKQNRDQGKKE